MVLAVGLDWLGCWLLAKGRTMPDESKAGNATPASEKAGTANLEQMNASELRQWIAKAQALEGKKIEDKKRKSYY